MGSIDMVHYGVLVEGVLIEGVLIEGVLNLTGCYGVWIGQ